MDPNPVEDIIKLAEQQKYNSQLEKIKQECAEASGTKVRLVQFPADVFYTGHSLYINPACVVYIQDCGNSGSKLQFSNGEHLVSRLSAAQLLAILYGEAEQPKTYIQ